MAAHNLTGFQVYVFCVIGIAISVILPILRKLLPNSGKFNKFVLFWDLAKPYLIIGAFSLIVGVLVVAFAGNATEDWGWKTAVLAGYAWDSTSQKIGKP